MTIKLTNDEFIKKSNQIRRNKYDCLLVKHFNNKTMVNIVYLTEQ